MANSNLETHTIALPDMKGLIFWQRTSKYLLSVSCRETRISGPGYWTTFQTLHGIYNELTIYYDKLTKENVSITKES